MSSHVISSGATSAYSVKSGDTLVVGSGGESDGSTVSSGGKEAVLSAGSSVSDTVLSGGLLTLSSGAMASTLAVSSGGVVQAGAGVISSIIVSGELVGGTVGVVDDVYGTLQIASGGRAQDVSLADGEAVVGPGGSALSLTLESAGFTFFDVASGGVATDTLAQADQSILDEGVTSGSILSGAFSSEEVYASAVSTTIGSGGEDYVQSGGVDIAALVADGGFQYVESGGLASRTEVKAGGAIILSSGGVASSVLIKSGGAAEMDLTVSSGQIFRLGDEVSASLVVSGITFDSGAYLSALSPVVDSGGILILGAGVSGSGVTVSAGGELSGGQLVGADRAYDDFNINIAAGLVVSATLINDNQYADGPVLQVLSGGEAEAINVTAYAELEVQSGGVGSAVVVSGDGSLLQIDSGGYVHVATIGGVSASMGQSANVMGSSVDDLIKSGGVEVVASGGKVTRATVSNGGQEIVLSGGEATNTVVRAGGEILLSSGGVVSGGVVSSGGVAVVTLDVTSGQSFNLPASGASGSVSIEGLTLSSGGILEIAEATVESDGGLYLEGAVLGAGVTVSSGGRVLESGVLLGDTLDQGMVEGATVGNAASDPARLDVASGGLASAVTVLNADLTVDAGGKAERLTISSGGDATVVSGGGAVGVQVDSGGALGVVSGATVTSATVSSGATLTLSRGVIASGVTAVVGVASANTVSSGVTVLSGGTLDRADLIISRGGMLDLDAGGVADSLTVSSGGLVSGAGRLAGASFNAGTVSGVVLAGFMADAGLIRGSDLSSGAVLDVEGVASGNVVSSGAAVVVESGGVTSAMALSSGASQTIDAGGESEATTVYSGGSQFLSYGVDSGTVVKAGGSETLAPAAVASGVTIDSGGTVVFQDIVVSSGQTVALTTGGASQIDGVSALAGATVVIDAAYVESGATLSLAAGASCGDVTVEAGGAVVGPGNLGVGYDALTYPDIADVGLISGVTVGLSGSAHLEVFSGAALENATDYAPTVVYGGRVSALTLDGDLTLLSGAVASRVVVESAGALDVEGVAVDLVASGGLIKDTGQATSVGVGAHGELLVGAGAVASDVSVASGGALFLDGTATITGGTVSSGGALILDEDGKTLQSGQTLFVGAVTRTTNVEGVVISKGGRENAADGNVASGATVTFGVGGALGYVDVESGAVLKGPGVIFGDSEIYGAISGITAEIDPDYSPSSGAIEVLGYTYGSQMTIESAGSAAALTVGSGGNVDVTSGGVATDYVIAASGLMTVDGTAISGQVRSGGALVLGAGAITGATVQSGGILQDDASFTVSSGVTAVEGTQTALIAISGARVYSGGVLAYGRASVLSGGVLRLNGSTPTGIDSDDTVLVSAGGVMSGSGDYIGEVTDLGLVSGVTVSSILDDYYPGGVGALTIYSGGAASAVTILADAILEVYSGGRVVNAVIEGAAPDGGQLQTGEEFVSSGGVASGGKVLSNGSAVFASGATVDGVVVSAGGSATLGFGVGSGQHVAVATSAPGATTTVDGLTLESGAQLTLYGVGVSSGGELLLGSNAVAEALTISRGGLVSGGVLAEIAGESSVDDGLLENAELGGVQIAATFFGASEPASEQLTIGSGGVGSNLTLVQGSIIIESGGVADGVRIEPGSGSDIQVEAGGVLEDGVIDAAPGFPGILIDVSGSAVNDVIGSGGAESVEYGGVDIGAVVQNGGELGLNGGVVSGATVLSGGGYSIGGYEGGQTEAVTISSGGHLQLTDEVVVDAGETLVDGAVASTTLISGATLLKGAIADYQAQVNSGGVFSVGLGGDAELVGPNEGLISGQGSLNEGVNKGKIEGVTLTGSLVDLGITSGVTIGKAGADTLSSGAAATGDIVLSGGEQIISSGATAMLETVFSGGQLFILAGGTASDVTVSSGGSATVQTIVSSGVTQTFDVPGSAAFSTFGNLKLESGATGALQNADVLSGGRLLLGAGLVAGGAFNDDAGDVGTGGVTVEAGGSVSGPGAITGFLTVSSGGFASGVSVVNEATDLVYSGARQSGVSVASGAELEAIGLAISGAVIAGTLSASEMVAGATIASGAQVTISSGAVAKGGSLQVLSGAAVEDLTTASGGVLTDDGAVTFDQSGTVDLAGTLSGAGVLSVTGAGTTLVLAGSGARFSGQTVISGGYGGQNDIVEIAMADGLGTADVVFDGLPSEGVSATLQVDAADTPAAGATFANALRGFVTTTDFLDLRGLAYSEGAKATISGSTLILTDGSRTEKFTLIGETASAFTVSSDGHGGTLISPTSAGAPTLAHAAAATVSRAAVTSGGAARTLGAVTTTARQGALTDPATALFVQAAAAFAPADPANLALVSAGATTSQSLLFHATASAGAAHV